MGINKMEFISILLDAAPVPPAGPAFIAKFLAAVSAAAGAVVLFAANEIRKIINKNKGDKK